MDHGPVPPRGPQQVFAFLFCSLDGCLEGPDGELGWGLHDEEFFDWNLRQTREVGALLLGRRTHEHFAGAWTSPDTAERLPEVTAFMNAMARTVVTRSGRVAPWGAPASPTAAIWRPTWPGCGPGPRVTSRSSAVPPSP
ncbi:dihydrofolate reductase family protein [Streptomyces albus]|uniref:dihydrofolate reductase family protein n=1 Tax=Streptomyces albus TaxID=1888 RepID=UPI003407B20A